MRIFLTSDIFCLIFTLSCISFLRQVSLSPINCNKKRSINPNRKTLLLAKWENTKENFACITFAFKLELCWVELYCLSDLCYTRFIKTHKEFLVILRIRFIKWNCQHIKIIYSYILWPPLRSIHDKQIKMQMTFTFSKQFLNLLSIIKF